MKILAFDNSTSTCVVALQIGDQKKYLSQTAPKLQARLILPMIDELLKSANLRLQDLNAIAYGCGPGSFTGIRIAVSVAQGLGYGANVQLLPISSLALLAQTAWLTHQSNHTLVAVDARMGQVYFAHYTNHPTGIVQLCGEEQVCKPEELKFLVDTNNNGVGDGWESYKDQFAFIPKTTYPNLIPSGAALLALAAASLESQKIVTPDQAMPVYLR